MLGTIVAYALVPMTNLKGAEKIAAALCARHVCPSISLFSFYDDSFDEKFHFGNLFFLSKIGGAVNFVAVSDILQTSPELVAAALAADNVVVALYFAFLFYISKPGGEEPVVVSGEDTFTGEKSTIEPATAIVPLIAGDEPQKAAGVTLSSLSMALSVALTICAFSHVMHSLFFISPILISSVIAVLLATFYPSAMGQISQAGGVIGVLFMQVRRQPLAAFVHVNICLYVQCLYA